MKLTVAILLTMAVISHQHSQRPRAGTFWPSSYSRRHSLSNYNPYYYSHYGDIDDSVIYDDSAFHSTPTIPYFPNEYYINEDLQHHPVITAHNDMAEFADATSRKKASFVNSPANPRFFLWASASTIANPFWKTITFTVTSSVGLTKVQSCIPAGNFVDQAAQATNCRRRRDILDPDALTDDAQFPINASKTQQQMSTMISSSFALNENRKGPLELDNVVHQNIKSSQNEDAVDETKELESTEGKHIKEKRYFLYNVISATLTSYSFFSTTVTVTVSIAKANQALCLPSGFVVC